MQPINSKHTQRRFNLAAIRGKDTRPIAGEIGGRLLERLDLVKVEPKVILDAGCGAGAIAEALRQRFKSALVIGADFAINSLQQSKPRWPRKRKWSAVASDLHQSGLADRSVDLVVCNLAPAWCELNSMFAEFRRLLRPEGLLLFTLFGPDTLKELKASTVDPQRRFMPGIDLHHVGDALLYAGFADPVMDVEQLTFNYATVQGLINDLRNAGWTNLNPERHRHLGQRRALRELHDNYERKRTEDGIPATFEVVYGHAIGPASGQPRRTPNGLEATFSVDDLKKTLRR